MISLSSIFGTRPSRPAACSPPERERTSRHEAIEPPAREDGDKTGGTRGDKYKVASSATGESVKRVIDEVFHEVFLVFLVWGVFEECCRQRADRGSC